jgi:hypothetical protein
MQHARKMGLIFDADGVNTPGTQRLFKTILGITNEERRYVFTKTSRLSKAYEIYRYKIYKLKNLLLDYCIGIS